MNSTHILQDYFKKYISCDNAKKNNIILECKKALPNEEKRIEEIKYVIDNLNDNEYSQQALINNIFDVENDMLRTDLMDNIKSQIENKTEIIDKINTKILDIIAFNSYRIDKYSDSFNISNNNIIDNFNDVKKIIKIGQEDTRFYNYIIEKLVNYSSDTLLYATDQDENYLISDSDLEETSTERLIKEEAICSTKEVEYYIDRIIDDKDRNKCINRIFLDLITNQNYRMLSNNYGVLNSDLKENEYYVLNDKTLKKEIAIESLYKNYYSEIKKISNIIIKNYDEIIELIDKLDYSSNVDKTYLNYLKTNIVLVYEKGKIQESLDQIETGKSIQNKENDNYKDILLNFEQSIGLETVKVRKIQKTNDGYASIFVLISGILLFGILFAYLMLKI